VRHLLRRLNRTLLATALALAAAGVVAQDYPIDPPGTDKDAGPVPPAGIALPELLAPPPDLVTPLALLDRLVVPGTRLQLESAPRRRHQQCRDSQPGDRRARRQGRPGALPGGRQSTVTRSTAWRSSAGCPTTWTRPACRAP